MRARSDLAIAAAHIEHACLEDLCFHSQQAAEKAIKALFLSRGVPFPFIHDISELIVAAFGKTWRLGRDLSTHEAWCTAEP